jgi:isopentenyl diphosphate isomerase/L-lactate dehydrogenase-like FMN-dependent dehydrogenase
LSIYIVDRVPVHVIVFHVLKFIHVDVDGRIILRGIFRKWEGIVGTGWSGLRIGTGGGHL